jgi:uncharacterized membrane protein
MTSTRDDSIRSALTFDRPLVLRFGVGAVVVCGVIAAAVLPQRRALGLSILPPVHLHAPDLALIAAASPAVHLHLLGVAIAIGVGLTLWAGVKGSRAHRVLGWTWVLAMTGVAVSSFFIRIVNHGRFSFIHLLGVGTLFALPMAVAAARRHQVRLHARTMTGIFTGGLILAGLFAFTPGRLMWRMVFG